MRSPSRTPRWCGPFPEGACGSPREVIIATLSQRQDLRGLLGQGYLGSQPSEDRDKEGVSSLDMCGWPGTFCPGARFSLWLLRKLKVEIEREQRENKENGQ